MIPIPNLPFVEAAAWRPWLPAHGDADLLAWYHALAAELPPRPVCVEVGVAHGRTAIYLAEQLLRHGLAGGKVYAVDSWDHLADPTAATWFPDPFAVVLTYWLAEATPEELELICPLRLPSPAAARAFADHAIDAVMIDADHGRFSVEADLRAWRPKVRPGGYLAGHDYSASFPGVAAAVDAVLGGGVQVFGSVWVAEL